MENELYLAVIIPTDPQTMFTTDEGEPFRMTTALWSSYGEAMQWGEGVAANWGTNDEGVPFAVCIVQAHKVDEFRKGDYHGLN